MQLQLVEIRAPGGGDSLIQLVQLLNPDMLYLPSQVSAELLQALAKLQPGACTTDEATTTSNASVYQWPAASENARPDSYTADADWIHLKSSRYFKFAKVRSPLQCIGQHQEAITHERAPQGTLFVHRLWRTYWVSQVKRHPLARRPGSNLNGYRLLLELIASKPSVQVWFLSLIHI